MEHKIFDQNAYRREYYKRRPEKRLHMEEANAVSLLRRLGYDGLTPPSEEVHSAAVAAIIASRMKNREARENGQC